jgi:hypothetical protein
LKPQHHKLPSVRIPHVWESPALTLAQVLVSPPTRTGAVRDVVLPSPS